LGTNKVLLDQLARRLRIKSAYVQAMSFVLACDNKQRIREKSPPKVPARKAAAI